MEFNNPHETDKHPGRWPEITTLFLGIIAVLLSLINKSRLLVIIPIAFLFLSVIFLIRDSGLFNRLVKAYRLKKINKKGDKEAKKNYSRFVLLVEKFELFRHLMDHLDRTEWNTKENYPHLGNIRFVNWYNNIFETAKGLKIKHLDEMELIAQRLRDFLDAFNEHYIQTFSMAYKLGQAKYPNEDFKKQIAQLKRQYDNVLGEYNDFCKEINSKCANSVLVPIYSFPPDLDWAKGDKL